ncbi:MAG: two component, sigma54 specific, transcriptional regulator, Fis family [Deltaproteobacteria bacterium]|nr:two component, sigma54 specific, transcriptional regulator, Fis family [Deltaproteobacteria bacterium]
MKTRGKIFLLDDDELIVSMLERALKGDGYEVRAESDPEGVLDRIRAFSPDVVLLDIKLPGRDGIDILGEIVERGAGTQVVMLTSDDTAETAVKAMKLGAADYLTKPFNLDEVRIVVGRISERRQLKNEVEYLRKISYDFSHHEIVGKTATIRKLKEKCGKFAGAAVPMVLITGESGTGKEVFARHIHQLMHQGDSAAFAPFLGINCAALPEQLIESELFGHEKGAFTDAKAEKKGIFEMAYGGSILLDEIGEMRLDLQAKLLRVLEERKVRRIGGRQDIPIEATVFATTNRDLEKAVESGSFRVDLFYRLNAFSLHLPGLRERKDDIPLLARHFLQDYSEKYKKMSIKDISPEVEELLVSYRWPGNIRELRNVIERIIVLESDEIVRPEHLPAEILNSRTREAEKTSPGLTIPDTGLSLEEMERNMIVRALAKAGRNKTLAAKLLGITYDSLRYQVKKFGLE